jgi:hypothetical protein
LVDFNRQPLDLGHVTASPAALTVLGLDSLRALLIRHAAGDWGDADEEIAAENLQALVTGRGVVTSYYTHHRHRIVIVTEVQNRQTSLLLAEEI